MTSEDGIASLDATVLQRLREIAQQEAREARTKIPTKKVLDITASFVKDELFHGKIPPDPADSRYFPSYNTVREILYQERQKFVEFGIDSRKICPLPVVIRAKLNAIINATYGTEDQNLLESLNSNLDHCLQNLEGLVPMNGEYPLYHTDLDTEKES